MQPEDICVLRLSDLVRVAGERKPSVEHRLHAYVLRARQDCGASIHTHQPIASAYTLLGRDLKIRQPAHQKLLGQKAALVSYAPSGTSWLASKLRKALRPDIHAYLLRNHGVVCCGATLRDTVARVKALESACSSFFREAIEQRITFGREVSSPEVLNLLCHSEELESVH
jgi:L-fuculose-phosphate aldolase